MSSKRSLTKLARSISNNTSLVQKAMDILFPGEIVSSIDTLYDKSREGPKSTIITEKINNRSDRQIVWKKPNPKYHNTTGDNTIDNQVAVQNNGHYAGLLPRAVFLPEYDFFAMEYVQDTSALKKILALGSSSDPEKQREINNQKLKYEREGIDFCANFVTRGEKIGQDNLAAKSISLGDEKENLYNDLQSIVDAKREFSGDEGEMTKVIESIKSKNNSAINDFAKLLANNENSPYRIYRVHGDLGPHHVLGAKAIDVDCYRIDFEIADLVRFLKNPIMNITDESRTIADINYFTLKRMVYKGKIKDSDIADEVVDVNNVLTSPKNHNSDSLKRNVALRKRAHNIDENACDDNFARQVYLFYLKNIREDIRILRAITATDDSLLYEYFGREYVADGGTKLKEDLSKWYSQDIHRAFDVLLDGKGRNQILKNNDKTITTLENLRNIVEGTVGGTVEDKVYSLL